MTKESLRIRLIKHLNKAIREFGQHTEPKQIERCRRKILATGAVLWRLQR